MKWHCLLMLQEMKIQWAKWHISKIPIKSYFVTWPVSFFTASKCWQHWSWAEPWTGDVQRSPMLTSSQHNSTGRFLDPIWGTQRHWHGHFPPLFFSEWCHWLWGISSCTGKWNQCSSWGNCVHQTRGTASHSSCKGLIRQMCWQWSNIHGAIPGEI